MNYLSTAEDYLQLIGDWKDPNPKPIITEHCGIKVVRDDLLKYGSKMRFIDYLISSHKEVREWVYCSPACGYAQISLPYVANKYGKRVTIFTARRKKENRHKLQKKAIGLGANFKWVKAGYMNVLNSRAKEYVAEDPINRKLLPLGIHDPTVVASAIRVARSIDYEPTEIWSVGGSGLLSMSLQLAYPNAKVHIVQVGGKIDSKHVGRAKLWKSPYKFDQPCKVLPPFPSVPNYDAKAWEFMIKYAKIGALFWNVGG